MELLKRQLKTNYLDRYNIKIKGIKGKGKDSNNRQMLNWINNH